VDDPARDGRSTPDSKRRMVRSKNEGVWKNLMGRCNQRRAGCKPFVVTTPPSRHASSEVDGGSALALPPRPPCLRQTHPEPGAVVVPSHKELLAACRNPPDRYCRGRLPSTPFRAHAASYVIRCSALDNNGGHSTNPGDAVDNSVSRPSPLPSHPRPVETRIGWIDGK
jgi:hypothetical protein